MPVLPYTWAKSSKFMEAPSSKDRLEPETIFGLLPGHDGTAPLATISFLKIASLYGDKDGVR